MKQIDTIIFDLGGVLIDWNPDYLYQKIIPDEHDRTWFLQNICTPEWNEEQDGGRSIADATNILINQFPSYKAEIEAFYSRWEEMLGGPISDTVTIFQNLKDLNKYKFYALTNWSAETFPKALRLYDFLNWFDGRLVSGEENTRKPFDEFYNLLFTRFNIDVSSALFIDDNLRNILAAQRLGLSTIHFTNPSDLLEELNNLYLLS